MRTLVFALLAGVAATVVIVVVSMLSSMHNDFEFITLSEWVERVEFYPVILQPDPENASLVLGPNYSHTSDLVEMVYIEPWDGDRPGSEQHNWYQSNTFTQFFGSGALFKFYNADREDVTISRRILKIDGQNVQVEVRKNESLANEGVTIFELGGTAVGHHWRGVQEDEALRLLEQNVQLITKNDRSQIEAFDLQLIQKSARVPIKP